MSIESGSEAQESGDYVCDSCHWCVYITKGETIPRCPKCGNYSYGGIDDNEMGTPETTETHKDSNYE
jgi:hypothetical protein